MTKADGRVKKDIMQEVMPIVEKSIVMMGQLWEEIELSDRNLVLAEEKIQAQKNEIEQLSKLLQEYQLTEKSWMNLEKETENLQKSLAELMEENTQLKKLLEELAK